MYYFKPMMAVYGKLLTAETPWLMSAEGRRLIAKAIRLCRNQYGRQEATYFYNALVCNGVIYPQIRHQIERAWDEPSVGPLQGSVD